MTTHTQHPARSAVGEHPEGHCLSVQCGRCRPESMFRPTVLDLDDPYFHGQTLPDVLRDYDHVHSTTGVCVKNIHGPCAALTQAPADASEGASGAVEGA